MKKVLYFVPEFPRLTETFIEREISKLIELGQLDITVFSMAKASGYMSDNVAKVTHYERLTWVASLQASFYFILRPRQCFTAFKLVLQDSSQNIIKRVFIFLKAVGYSKMFEKYRPDHIHSHFLSEPSTIALVASKILGVPFSVSAHAKDIFVDGTLISVKAREARFIAICNEHGWQEVVKQANKESKSGNIRLLFHGVDAEKVFGSAMSVPKPNQPYIFTAARLVEKKGLRFLIEASKILKDKGIANIVNIAGAGPLYQELTDLITELDLQGTVTILGDNHGIPNREVMGHLVVADIFALPNIETKEGDVDGVPTTIIEAALAKKAIVTTAAGSTTDLIEDGETGLIVKPSDSQALAEALKKLLTDENLRATLGNAAFIKASKMFDIEKNVTELQGLFLD